MSQVLSEINLEFSGEEDITLLDKANKFNLSFFLTVFSSPTVYMQRLTYRSQMY